VKRTFGRTREDLVRLWAEQARRWASLEGLGASRRRAVARFGELVERELALVEEILALAGRLEAGTIETVMAKSDLQLGLEALLGDHHPPQR
jgi:hypothetical protein